MASHLLRVKLHYNSEMFNCSKAEHLSYWNKQRTMYELGKAVRYFSKYDDCRTQIASLFLMQHHGITKNQYLEATASKRTNSRGT